MHIHKSLEDHTMRMGNGRKNDSCALSTYYVHGKNFRYVTNIFKILQQDYDVSLIISPFLQIRKQVSKDL